MANYTPIKVAYKAFEPVGGSNDKLAPVIFLHGSTGSKEMWDDLPQKIANGTKRKTYTYDARSHGETESTQHYNFDLNVDDLFHFMDGLNIRKAILVGHSMGGVTVARAALRKPERVEMIFSEDMYVKKIPGPVLEAVSRFITIWSEAVQSIPKDLSEREAFNKAVDILYEKNKESETFSTKEGLKNSNLLLKRKAGGGYDVNFDKEPLLRAFKNPETLMSSPSGEFKGPAYFLYGGNSPFAVGSEEADIKKHFPNAELIEFEGASHNVHAEFPDKFAQTLLSRLQ